VRRYWKGEDPADRDPLALIAPLREELRRVDPDQAIANISALESGLALAGAGLLLGVAGALVLTRGMQSMLFSVSATDPAVFATIVALLAAVSLLACYLPARRAARSPLVALRHE